MNRLLLNLYVIVQFLRNLLSQFLRGGPGGTGLHGWFRGAWGVFCHVPKNFSGDFF